MILASEWSPQDSRAEAQRSPPLCMGCVRLRDKLSLESTSTEGIGFAFLPRSAPVLRPLSPFSVHAWQHVPFWFLKYLTTSFLTSFEF